MKLRVYNKTLDPNIWNDDKTLKPDIRDDLLKIAEDFYKFTDLKGDIHNILFLGSSANYNWSPVSDIDLHVVIDITQERITMEYARKFMDGLAYKWNTEHDIEIKGHPVEIYLQDLSEPNSTPQLAREGAAIYSLLDNKWLLEPNPQKIKLDCDKIRKKYQQLKKRIQELTKTENIENLRKLMKSIRNYRNDGLLRGGEFSTENLVFKALRVSGNLKRLKDTINTIYDRKVSLPEGGNILPDKKTPSQNLNEIIDKKYNAFLGFINRNNFKIIGSEAHGMDFTHGDFEIPHNWRSDDVLPWRYRKDLNIVYWWYSGLHPTDDEREEVKLWLEKNLGIKNPKQEFMSGIKTDYMDNRIDAHTIDESKELLAIINANLKNNFILF